VDRLLVPGGEGRMMRKAAIAATMTTRITRNTRDLDRLGLLSELRLTGSISVGCVIWMGHWMGM
jgi:hypothetical protein